ncbi:MAG: hypothetical protein K6G05_08385 [Lachnospiraceae bacterium]|nr:hypothetical protein [Lachnospiraceae bacterium]
MTYEEVVQEILEQGKFGSASGFEDIQSWMKILGPMDEGLQVIHIAGTNGKGSTSMMVASILATMGFRVGLFTSPHLKRFTERIRIVQRRESVHGESEIVTLEIPKADLARLGEVYLRDVRLPKGNMLDYTLMIALSYFQEQDVDYVVLETGLGGRLDSTTGLTVTPVVSAITSISLEHTAILGDTIEAIAREKAGIIKPNTKVVIGCMEDAAAEVIEDVCKNKQVGFHRIQESDFDAIPWISIGYQRRNEACARAIIEVLDLPNLSEECMEEGIRNTNWPGRLEVIHQKNPWFMVDGAHNPEGVRALRESLEETFPGEKYVFIMGVLKDRKYETMVREILPLSDEIWTVTPKDERALPAEVLAKEICQIAREYRMDQATGNCVGVKAMSVKEACLRARKERDRRVVALGSLYLIGEIRDEISIQNGGA